jgi:hypothetical protein
MLKTKKIIFDLILSKFPEFSDLDHISLDSIMFTRRNNIRLTYKGMALLSKIADSYKVRINRKDIKAKDLITLTRKFTFPYYFGQQCMVLFDDEDATMLALYGDATRFIRSMDE